MFTLKKNLNPGTVIWAKRKIFYDRPGEIVDNRRSMYLVTMINHDYFLGCPLTTNASLRNSTVLKKSLYPIKWDSKINECLYKLTIDDIVSSTSFKITEGTFNHFKRDLYRRIIVGSADSPTEYNEMFVEEFLKDNQPRPNNVVVYPSEEKIFKYYYVYEEDENDYVLIKLNKEETHTYSLSDPNPVKIPKSIRFFDYFSTHNITRESVIEFVNNGAYQKKIGTIY